MYSLLTSAGKNAVLAYHKVMLAYNSILYRDCLDMQMKEQFYKKTMHHKQKINNHA
jgi:hypothetical protein